MAPSPIPAPLPPWSRWLLQLEPLIQTALQHVLEHIGVMHDAASPSPDTWCHIQCIGQPTGSVDRADDFVTTFDVVNITNGSIDSSWIQTDFDQVYLDLFTCLNAWAPHMSIDYQWREVRFYLRSFNPLSDARPFTKMGPPAFMANLTTAGTGAGFMGPQSSVTTTDRTAFPKHWGRNYWPHPCQSMIAAGGHIPSAQVDSVANAVHTMYSNWQGNEFYPVVPVTQVDGVPTRGLLGVSELQVDNVPDVIRRRRPNQPTYKKRLSV